MSSFLDKIVAQKKLEVADAENITPKAMLIERALERRSQKLDFMAAVTAKTVNIIAEVKRASPSKGIINADLNAPETAMTYEKGGAAAISVLTDEQFFKGTLLDLISVSQSVNIPVLRKDFTISDYQIYEAAAFGADAVLLIARILTTAQIEEYLGICNDLNLTALVEVYDHKDVLKIKGTAAKLIGINNRNLATFDTNVAHALNIAETLEPQQVPVVASGIFGPNDLKPYLQKGIKAFLVGESLVRHKNTEQFLQELVNTNVY